MPGFQTGSLESIHSKHTEKGKKKSFELRLSIPNSASKRDINIPKAGKRLSNGSPQLESCSHTELSSPSKRTQEQLLFAGKWYLNNSLFKNLEMENIPIDGQNVLVFLFILLLLFFPIC